MGNDPQAELEPSTNVLPRTDRMGLQDILRSDEGALANAVRRLADSLDEDTDPYAAHGSSPVPDA
jgi:hypothetical protein